jgi:hypothetical protein
VVEEGLALALVRLFHRCFREREDVGR